MLALIQALALLLSGYSIFSAIVLAFTHFHLAQYQDQPQAQRAGLFLLVLLSFLQLAHVAYLYAQWPWPDSIPYRMALFAVAPAFYWFSSPLLTHTGSSKCSTVLPHFIPVLLAALLPPQWALPLAFAVGAGYLLWLGRRIYALRAQRKQFRLELIILGSIFSIAVLVMLLGLSLPVVALLSPILFFSLYAIAIGSAFFLVNLALNYTPQLALHIVAAAQATYNHSTLTKVDIQDKLQQLHTVLLDQQQYANTQLNLATVAALLNLSTHQLSELINLHLGKNFSRLLREYRIQAAQAMLTTEPNASVLSVSLSVGFSSQSNFYEAFREIAGMTPAHYRKLHLSKT